MKFMKFIFTNFAIVIVAQEHNPTILHPTFIKANKICPDDFQPVGESILSTPAISNIAFTNKISITAEASKVQFIDPDKDRIPENSLIPDIAKNYIRTLPHVRYTGLGINFRGHLEKNNSERFDARQEIFQRFFKEGAWGTLQSPKDMAIKFHYKKNNMKYSIELQPGSFLKNYPQPIDVIIVSANCHRDLPDENPVEVLTSSIMSWKDTMNQFLSYINDIFELGE